MSNSSSNMSISTIPTLRSQLEIPRHQGEHAEFGQGPSSNDHVLKDTREVATVSAFPQGWPPTTVRERKQRINPTSRSQHHGSFAHQGQHVEAAEGQSARNKHVRKTNPAASPLCFPEVDLHVQHCQLSKRPGPLKRGNCIAHLKSPRHGKAQPTPAT